MSDQDMAKRIRTLRTDQDLTLEEVAKGVGVSKSTVRKWETGEIANMRRDKIAALAKALHTSPAYLMGWTDEPYREITMDNLFRIETKKFPLLGSIACGEPIFADEHLETYIEAGSGIEADFCLKVKGDSMIGAGIQNGDIVFIKKQSMVDDGEIAAVLIENNATLKRVYYDRANNVFQLFAENPKYKTLRYSGESLNQIRILGKAVALQRDII